MDFRDLQQSLPQASGLSRQARQVGTRSLSTEKSGWERAASPQPPPVAQSAAENMELELELGLPAMCQRKSCPV